MSNGSGGNSGTAIALFGLIFLFMGFLALTAIVLQSVLVFSVLLMIAGFFLYGLFHYVVWGRWLSKQLEAEEEETK